MNFRKPYISWILPSLVLVMVVLSISCSTKKNTFTRRAYHNLTSHYNVYWNGREALREAEEEMRERVQDNYTEVLPVFNYGTKKEAQSNNQQYDRAIQKASIAIQKHSMVFNGREYVKWIDDCYMLIGQAYFYKQEYLSARRTFNFIIREYEENDIKYDAMLWLARTYIETGEFEKSLPQLNLVDNEINEENVPYRILQELPQVYAQHYLKQRNYNEAVPYLYDAISYGPGKQLKTRLMFILGQIFEQSGDLNRASDLYGSVVRRNPVYDMAFQAKLNMARSFDAASGDSREIVKILNKMLKDEKNKDYQDQIYYALAEVAFKENNISLAIENLKMSVSSSTNNNYQKSKSALRVADLYFAIPEYEQAQAYYDTAMMFIPKDYPDFSEISTRTNELTDLTENLITIYREDSLQRLVNMSENDRNKIIDKMIQDHRDEQQRLAEQRRIQQEINKQENISAFNAPATGMPIGSGDWYFYNTATKDYGYNEFIKKWGKRKYEELWRLSNKTIVAYVSSDDNEIITDSIAADTVPETANNPLSRDYYLKDLPFSEEALQESNLKIREAYFELGKIYHEGLKDFEESNEALLALNDRFPENPHKLQSSYYLFKNYTALGNPSEAEFYKNLIIDHYPESDYAKVLSDPEYYARIAAQKDQAEELYEQTWQAYKDEQYFMAIARADMALSTYGDSIALAPKFAYVKAISRGKIEVIDTLVSDLQRIIKQYPSSEIKTLSQSMLASIAGSNPEIDPGILIPDKEPEEIPSPYSFRGSGQHMFMIVVDSREVRLNPLKVKISDFNQKYFSLENLTVNSMVLSNKYYIVTVGNFNNSTKAQDYYNLITTDEYVYSDLNPGTFDNFVISTENYGTFFKEKDLNGYKKFFAENYQQ